MCTSPAAEQPPTSPNLLHTRRNGTRKEQEGRKPRGRDETERTGEKLEEQGREHQQAQGPGVRVAEAEAATARQGNDDGKARQQS